MYFKTIIKS